MRVSINQRSKASASVGLKQRFFSKPLLLLFLLLAGQLISIPFLSPRAWAAPVQIILTSGATWTVPPAWDNTNNTIEAIGAGGNGAPGLNNTYAGAGGGGGEYRQAVNVSLTPNSTVDINIPSGGAGSATDGAWLKNSGGTIQIEAKNGGNASGATAGTGGTGGTGSALNFDGGAGGSGGSGNNNDSAGGGGGSAGPNGTGKAGGNGVGATSYGGGGGGGSNGGSSTAGVTPTGVPGGNGGNNTSGIGGGSGGSSRNSNDAVSGNSGGGGGGGSQSTGSTPSIGGDGSVQDLWDTGVGPSGGGGGGGGCGGTGCTVSHLGGAGGAYGGGAGGCGMSGSHAAANCPSTPTGGQGIIVITYTPSVSPSITQADYRLFENPAGLGSTPWQQCRSEQGETTIPGGSASTTVTLSQSIADVNQAYLLMNFSGTSSVQSADDSMATGQITNATTLTFTRGAASGGDAEISYAVVECFQNEFSVQRGTTTIATGTSSNTASISAVDTGKSMVIVSSYSDDSSANEQTGLATGSLQDSTTVQVSRYDSPTINATVAWQVVTFSNGSGATVQTGQTTLASGNASDTATISSVDTAHSWLYCSYDADSNGLRQNAVGCDLTDSTTVTVNRYASSAYINNVRWYVVSFPSDGVNVQRGAVVDTGSTTDNTRYDINIPLNTPVIDITKAFSFVTNTTSGTGTAFPRNQWISQLTDASTLQTSFWRGSSNGNGTHYWQVMEFAPSPADVGTPLSAENTSATLRSTDRPFRLRMLLGVSDATLAQDTAFKLQYAPLSGSCSASSYSDVTGSSTISYRNFDSISDKTPLVANVNDPVDGTNTTETQTYVESNNFANSQSALSPGEDGEWDFSLADNGAGANSAYCFRIVHSDGGLLDAYTYYPLITTSDGVFQTDIVDSGGTPIANPSVTMSPAVKDVACNSSSGTLGTSSERLRVVNHSANIPWSMSIAATDGTNALWTDGSALFDFNDPSGAPAGCSAGADADVYAGQLSFAFGSASISPESGCSSSGVTLGSNAGFNEGTLDSVTLASAGSSAETGCYWDIQGIDVAQSIPGGQPSGNYSLDLTVTVVAN